MRREWMTRNLVIVTIISLTQDAASDLLYPLLPLLMASVSTAPALLVGVTEGLADFMTGLTVGWAGRKSDEVGRRRFISVGYGLAGLGKFFVIVGSVWPVLMLGRLIDRFGKGLRGAPRDSLLADNVPDEHLGRAFGFHRAGDTLGAVIGPIIALVGLSLLNNDVRKVAMWALVPAVISVLLTFLVKDTRGRLSKQERERNNGTPLSSDLKHMIGLLALVSVSNVPDALLLLHLSQIGISASGVVLAYVLFNVIGAALALPAGTLSDRYGRGPMYAVGLAAFAVSYIGLGITTDPGMSYLFMGLYGIFPAFTDGVGKAWVTELADSHSRGKAQGAFKMWQTFGILAAGTWAGLLWNIGSGNGGTALVIAGCLAAIGGLVVFHQHPQRRKTRH